MGQDLVLFKDAQWRMGPAGPRLPAPRRRPVLRPRRGRRPALSLSWLEVRRDGKCLETPAEPTGSKLCERVRQRSYPVHRAMRHRVCLAGPGAAPGAASARPPPFPAFDCFTAPATHTFAFKGLWNANWLQAFEVGIDPAHPSFLHRFLQDEALDAIGDNAAGKQFRSASAGDADGEHWPMTRIMREFASPRSASRPQPWGMQLTALRPMTEASSPTCASPGGLPPTFVIPCPRP
jgi:phthalate 4,5-dioxygenase oxygenase subunit